MDFIQRDIGGLLYMAAPNIETKHCFTTRHGGVSQGIYASLNLGEHRGDSDKAVRQNYEILCKKLGLPPERLVFSKQVHEAEVRRVTGADVHRLTEPVPYEADGLITDEKNLPLVIFTADCVPILFYDPVKSAVGASHAGWRGTVKDIAGETVRRMAAEFGSRPEDIRAAVGPSISKCCYETGHDVAEGVIDALGEAGREFIKELGGGKYLVDLKGANCRLLRNAGVTGISVSRECTMCSSEKYWSHRVTGGLRGSQASIITL